MTYDPGEPVKIGAGFFRQVLSTADGEAAHFAKDPLLRQALAEENRIGGQIAWYGRQAAVVVVALLLPILNPHREVFYAEALLALFLFNGWLGWRFARAGQPYKQAFTVVADVLLLACVVALPNPLSQVELPTAFGLRDGTFEFLYVILAFATLSYNWRTIWTIGLAVTVVWMTTVLLVALFGQEVPEMHDIALPLAAFDPRLVPFADLNSVQWDLRLQEVVIFMIIAGALTLKGWRTNQLILRQARLAAERANLSRYFAPTMVEALAKGSEGIGAPKKREIAVMFTDLVGFTDMAERLPDAEVLVMLRRYYSAIERVVFENGGTLDKYLGDGVMATFGTPLPGPRDAANAARAARQIVEAVDAIGGALSGRVSVGVHYGLATIGDVGPERRLEFAVIGDTVNVASRLESATRGLGVRVILSDTLVARAKAEGAGPDDLSGFVRHQGLTLRGRQGSVDVWTAGTRAG